jgi:predicted nuclease of predicted toxin-antitoxin system
MSILVDQCVPRKFLRELRSWGYDASPVSEHIKADSPDTAVIALAQQLDAVLLTVDLDFSNIFDYPPANFAGIMVMRYEIQDEVALMATLRQALLDLYRDDLRSSLVIIEAKRYRVRRS